MQVAKAKDGNADTVKQYMLGSGMTSSALEHSVPEQLFSTPDNPAEAISTVKALQIANNQGIPIYTVNQSNLAAVLPQLQIDSQIKADIQNAVNAGKVVTVSKSNISFNGWNGCGYIITDPETGAGAYMISGGTSGALLPVFLLWGCFLFIGIMLTFPGFPVLGILLYSVITNLIVTLTQSLVTTGSIDNINWTTSVWSLIAGNATMAVLMNTMMLGIPFFPLFIICALLLLIYIFMQSLPLYSNFTERRKAMVDV